MNQVLVQAGLIASENQIQAELVQSTLSQAGLSAETKNAILSKLDLINKNTLELYTTKACTKEKLLNILATEGIVGADAEAIVSQLGLSGATATTAVSFDVLTASIWANIKALGTWLVTNPIGWAILGGTTILGLVKTYDALTESEKEAKEALESAKSTSDSYKSTINEVASSHRELSKSANGIAESYAKFAQGVDTATNKNLSLSNSDYEEFLDLNSQLADLFPALIKGYDENGNAILNLGGNIDTVTGKIQALVEQQERLANKEILDNLEDYVNGDDDGGGQLEEIKRLEKEKKKADDLVKTYGPFQDLFNGKKIPSQDLGINEISEIFKRAGVDYTKLDMDEDGWDISSLSPTDLSRVKDAWHNYYEELTADAQIAKDELSIANAEMSSEMMYWVQSLSQYTGADENMQTAILNMVGGIDWTSVDATDYDGAKDAIRQLVLTPLSQLSDDPAAQKQFSTAISGLFALNTADVPAEQAKEVVTNYIQQIMDILNRFRSKDNQLSLDDVYSMFGFADFNADTTAFSNSLSKIAGSNTSDMKKLSDYTKDFTVEQQQAWMNATNGAKDAEEAIRMYNEAQEASAPKSFKEAWKSLDKDAKDELKELAKAGELTVDAFKDSSIAAQFMKDTGLSAEAATKEINELFDSLQQISSMKTGITTITSAYDEKKEAKDNRVGADTLDSMRETLGIDDNWGKKDLKVWEDYKKAASDTSISLKDFKKQQDALASSYVNSNNFLANLTTENQDYYDALLTEMGITNAYEITTKLLADSIKYSGEQETFTAEKGKDLADATSDEIQKFIEAQGGVDNVSKALLKLALEKEACNDHVLDFSGDCSNLLSYAKGITKTTTALEALQAAQNHDWEKVKELGYDPKDTSLISKLTGDAEKEVKKAKNKQVKTKTNTKTTPGNKSNTTNSGSGSSGSSKDKTKETKQSFDWLERKISALTDKLDFLKSKIENVFSVKKKNSFLDQEIKKTNALIKTYQKQAKVYKKQANASASYKKDGKKTTLSKDIRNKIQNGQIKGSRKKLIQEYGEPTANAIQKYQDYWDKYQDARKNIQSAKKSKRELQIEKQQNWVDHYDALSDKYDAQMETKATAKEKNKLEDKKIKSTEKSYDHQIKIAKKKYGKKSPQVAALKAERENAVREIKLQQYQNTQDEADGYRDMLEAQKENAASAAEKNSLLAQEVQYINASYDAQIKAANEQKNMALAAQLQAEWQKTLLDLQIEQLQNLSDEQSAQYDLNQQKAANADTAKEKNQYEAESRKNLQSQYAYEMQIAAANGDLVEQERLRLELEQKMEESYQKQIQNIREEYDLILGMNDARKSTMESQIAALQANGYGIGTDLYQQQIALDKESYKQSLKEIRRISAEMLNLSGDALKEEEKNLEAEKQKAWQYQQSIAETQQAINDINIGKLERIGTLLGYDAENLEHIQNILSHSDFTLSDQDIGGLTIEGLSNMAVSFAQMSNNTEQIANLYDQIAEKQRQLTAGEYVDNGDQLTEEIDTLIKEARDLEEANYDFGESIKDLVVDSLNSLSDALDESISKYKDALQAQKDLYDYRRKVADQLKSIASLEKQLAALQGSDTEEARARIQKLQVELEDERQNLKDTEYDKYIQDQEEMLDKVSEDFQDFIADVVDASVSEICEAMSAAVTDNLVSISTAIERAFTKSSKIGDVATSIAGLKEVIQNLDFSGNVRTVIDENGNLHYVYSDNKGNLTDIKTDNNANPGTVTGITANGANAALPKKEVTGTEDEINAAAQVDKLKRTIRGAIDSFPSYVQGREFDLTTDSFLRFLYDNFGKMLTVGQESALIKKLGVDTTQEKDEQQWEAVLKLKDFGFSHGGVAAELNKVALANGDDGWATLKRGESVLTPDQTEQFRRLTENLIPLNTAANALASLSQIPASTKHSTAATSIRNVDIHLDGSNVVDADSFIKTLHNPRVLKEVSNGVSSQLGTVMSNTLGRF